MSEYDPRDADMSPADAVDIEAPRADMAEQHQPVVPAEDDDAWDRPLPAEADLADAIEQRRVVTLNEDEDR